MSAPAERARIPRILAVGGGALGIALAPIAPMGWELSRHVLGPVRDQLSGAAAALLALLGARQLARGGRWPEAVRWVAGIGAVAWGVLRAVPLEGERLHVVQYGLVTVLLWAGMSPRRAWWVRALLAAAGSFGFGCLEEAWQAWLPNRAGEWRDALLNAVGACCGVLALLPWAGRGVAPSAVGWRSRQPRDG